MIEYPHYYQSLRTVEGEKGRSVQEVRAIINGILWICSTGASWQDMPAVYPPYQICYRYFKYLVKDGTWDKVLRCLAEDLKEGGKIDITECFIKGAFASAKKVA